MHERRGRVEGRRGRIRDRRADETMHFEQRRAACAVYEEAERVGLLDLRAPVEACLDPVGKLPAQELGHVGSGERCGSLDDRAEIDAAQDLRTLEEIGRIELVADDVAERGLYLGRSFRRVL